MLGVVLTVLHRGGSSFSAAWSPLGGNKAVKETYSDSKLSEQWRGAAGEPLPCPQPGMAGRERVPGAGLGLGQVRACGSETQKRLAGIGIPLLFFCSE